MPFETLINDRNTLVIACYRDDESIKTLKEVEKEQIQAALEYTHWNKRETAKLLGMARSTLLLKIKRYDIYQTMFEKKQ